MTPQSRPAKRLRIRSKRLEQLDETKLALAFWLMAKDALTDDSAVNQLDAASRRVVSPLDKPATSDRDEAA